MASVDDDLTPGRWNFTRTQGDRMRGTRFAVVIDGTPVTDGAIAQVRAGKSRDADLVLDLAPTVDGDQLVVGDGIYLDVEPNIYWWDLEVDELTVIQGTFQVLADVSNEEGS